MVLQGKISTLCTKNKRIKIEEELDCLTADGIIEPRKFADWVAPIDEVPMLKGGQTMRICGDFK